MKINLQKYSEYKDSGVEWLGEIPESWEVKRLKFLGNIYAGLNGKKGDDFSKEYSAGIKSYIPFTNICNNIRISEDQFHFVKVDEKERQNRVLKNDILFLMSSETLDDIAKNSIYTGNEKELYLNSFCKGFRISNENIYPEYVNYLFLSSTYRSYFSLVGRGFTRINLKQEFINDAFALIPSHKQQTTIANFLDRKTALIDQAVDIKQKQIELLKERRQILIHEAVTRGINAGAKLKDSGVEWIGKIPEGWEVKKVKHFGGIKSGESVVNSLLDDSGQYEVYGGNGNMGFYNKFNVEGIKIIIGRVGAYCGNVRFINERKWVSDNALILTLNDEEIYSYLAILLEIGNLNNLNSSNAQPLITGSKVLNFQLPIPSKNERSEIQVFINKIKTKIATAISLKEQEIEKLKEYKATLINSAVTGKIKISNYDK